MKSLKKKKNTKMDTLMPEQHGIDQNIPNQQA